MAFIAMGTGVGSEQGKCLEWHDGMAFMYILMCNFERVIKRDLCLLNTEVYSMPFFIYASAPPPFNSGVRLSHLVTPNPFERRIKCCAL
jgi:hypothetical protein